MGGVSQIEEFGIDASELPNELLNAIEEAAVNQLLPGQTNYPSAVFGGAPFSRTAITIANWILLVVQEPPRNVINQQIWRSIHRYGY